MLKNKERKIDFINLLTLYILFFIMYLIVTRFTFVYGSVKDWNCQHWVFPEYFRNLFYETYDLFPDFAFNIGSGQNIYNFAYFGLLNPIVLFSYLFPFISMRTYIIISSIVVLLSGTTMMYFFLKKKFNSKIAFLGAFFYLMATPLSFHSHRHIMFVDYMPFLLMAYMGVDQYFNKNKRILLIISITLMIFTSFYYSVSGILSVIIYGVYVYLDKNKFRLKNFIIDGLKFIAPIMCAVFISGILILPTFFSLLNGRSGESDVNILMLLVPNFRLDNIIYSSYSMGLSIIVLYSLIENYFSKEIKNKYLVILIALFITFPILLYILNGTLYVDSKVLITFIPLGILLICNTLNRFNKKFDYRKYFNYLILLLIISLLFSDKYFFLIILELLLLYYSLKKIKEKNNLLYLFPVLLFTFVKCVAFNCGDFLVLNSYQDTNKDYVDHVLNNDKSAYRFNVFDMSLNSVNRIYNNDYYSSFVYSSASNTNYKDFYYMIGNEIVHRSYGMLDTTNNIFFNIYMGNKYLIGNNKSNDGSAFYEKIHDNVYVYNGVLPIGYSTNKLMSRTYFDGLDEVDKYYALLKYIIVDEEVLNSYESPFKEIRLNPEIVSSTINYTSSSNQIKFVSNAGGRAHLKINEDLSGKTLIIMFDMKEQTACKIGDSYITINGITNKLTCTEWKYQNKNSTFTYVLSSKEIKDLKISVSKGNYTIENIRYYTIDNSYLNNIKEDISELVIDREKTKGDKIYGIIDAKDSGYVHLSIAYDKGYKVLVDGKEVEYTNTDINFIGFKVDKGLHTIEIEYESPLKKEGVSLSILGFIILGGFYVIDFKYDRKYL